MDINHGNYIQYIINYFGKSVFRRGKKYAMEHRVFSLSENEYANDEGRFFTAYIKGGRRQNYFLKIHLGIDNEILGSYCDCPYDRPCKHLAATLYFLYKKDILLFDDSPEETLSSDYIDLSGHKDIADEKFEEIVKRWGLEFLKNHSGESVSSIANADSASAEDIGGKFRLVFKIYREIFESIFYFKPMSQYIKKNGETGRLKKYNEQDDILPLSPDEQYILGFLKESGSLYYSDVLDVLTVPLSEIIEIIYNLNDYTVYFEKVDRTMVEMKFLEGSSLEIEFIFDNYSDHEISFLPALILLQANEKRSSLLPYEFLALKGSLAFFSSPDDFSIFYQIIDFEESLFLKKMQRKNIYSLPEIYSLDKLIQDAGFAHIAMNFSYNGIRIVSPDPFLILNIDESKIVKLHEPNKPFENVDLVFKYTVIKGEEARERLEVKRDDGQDEEIISFEAEKDQDLLQFVHADKKNNEILVIKRSRKKERNKLKEFYKYFDGLSAKLTPDYANLRQFSANTFLAFFGLDLMDKGYEIRFNKKTVKRSQGPAISIRSGIDWLNLDVKLDETSLKDLHENWREIERGLIRSQDNYYIMSKEDLQKLRSLLAFGMNEKGKLDVSMKNFAFLEDFSEEIEKISRENENIKNAILVKEKLKNFSGIEKISVPASFNGKLRQYQLAGLRWLNFLYEHGLNGILADDMGLGKTIQVIALLCKLFEEKKIKRVLVVAPVTTLANWENELQRFSPDLQSYRHHGQRRSSDQGFLKSRTLTLVSYQTLLKDILLFQELDYDYLIMDESQNIKNHKSKAYRALRRIKAKHKAALTGTPIENSSLELWAQMDMLNPGLLGNESLFKKNFLNKIDGESDAASSDLLKKIIHPFLLRRKKQDVLKSLPPKEEIVYYCEMGEKQEKIYRHYANYFHAKMKGILDDDGLSGPASMEILNALMRLRQAALFPDLLDKKHRNIPSAKFEAMKALVEKITEEGHKVLIFSQFVQILSRIKKYLDGRGIKYSYLDGKTRKREKVINMFRQSDDIPVFLISLKAGGVGINLTEADYVIIFDPWWNPAVEAQAVDRSHRIGQQNKVIAYRLISRATIEEKILELQNKKKKIVQDVISRESGILKELHRDEILNLFVDSSE